MRHKTRGIVISYVRYGESGIIVRIYTELFGLQSYIVNSVRSAKSRTGAGLFQPLTLLNLVAYHKSQEGINRLAEVHCAVPYASIPFSGVKTSLVLFLAELLNKILKEESGNPELFEFLFSALEYLDVTKEQPENFHLHFLLRLAAVLGIAPLSPDELLNTPFIENADTATSAGAFEAFSVLLPGNFGTPLFINASIRRFMLTALLQWFNQHFHTGELRSLAVLREISET